MVNAKVCQFIHVYGQTFSTGCNKVHLLYESSHLTDVELISYVQIQSTCTSHFIIYTFFSTTFICTLSFTYFLSSSKI